MKTLTPLQPIPSLQGNTAYSEQTQTVGASAREKTVITGEVIKDLGNLDFLIKVGDNQIRMQSQTPLKTGQHLRLAVAQADPLELKILSETTETRSAPTQARVSPQLAAIQLLPQSTVFAAKPINLGNLFTIFTGSKTLQTPLSSETFTNIANFYSLQRDFLQHKADGGKILQQLINHLGLNHEHAIKTNQAPATTELKNSLFEILATLSDNQQLSSEAQKLTKIIEFFQLANIAQANQNEQLIPLPFSFLDQGFLRVFFEDETPNNSGSDDNRIKFSLYLKMSRIGNLQIDLTGSSEGIYLHLHTESETITTFLKEYISQLTESISFHSAIRGIRFSEDAIEPAGVLLKVITPQQSVGLVNTKA